MVTVPGGTLDISSLSSTTSTNLANAIQTLAVGNSTFADSTSVTSVTIDTSHPTDSRVVSTGTILSTTIGSSSNSVFDFSGQTGGGTQIVTQSSSGSSQIILGNTNNLVALNDASGNIVNTGGSNSTVIGGNGNGVIIGTALSGSGSSKIVTGTGTTTVVAASGDNTIVSGGNNSVIGLGSGNNVVDLGNTSGATVWGGAGGGVISGGTNSTVVGGTGSVATTIMGGNGSVVFAGTGSANNVLVAGSGNETLSGAGSSGNNTFTAGSGNTIIGAGTGNDTIVGGTGNTTMFGGLGNNVFSFTSTTGSKASSTVGDFKSTDKISLSGFTGLTAAQVLAGATVQTAGSTTYTSITLPDGTKLLIIGSALSASNFS